MTRKNTIRTNSDFWLAICILSVFAFGIVFGLVLQGIDSKKFLLGSDGRIQWETLSTGVVAVFAAFFTVKKISEQIRQTERIERRRRIRRERAARLLMPIALVEFNQYTMSCMQRLWPLSECKVDDIEMNRDQLVIKSMSISLPALSDDVLPIFKECVEFGSDRIAEELAVLIRKFQIQNARLKQTLKELKAGEPMIWKTIERDITDAAELHARAGLLYGYSRGFGLPREGLTVFEVENALNQARIWEAPQLAQNWQRYYSGQDDAMKALYERMYVDDCQEDEL